MKKLLIELSEYLDLLKEPCTNAWLTYKLNVSREVVRKDLNCLLEEGIVFERCGVYKLIENELEV